MAQQAFSTLIVDGELEVFLEVFEAYNALCKSEWDAGHDSTQPFQSALTLQFPCDWEPSDERALLLALGKIRVDVLSVQAHPDASEASASACRCLAALLSNGPVSVFRVGTALALPSEVVRGIQLAGVKTLGLSHTSEQISAQALKTYDVLASGLAECHALEALSLQLPPTLLARLGACFEKSGWPALKSIGLYMGASRVDGDGLPCVQGFMQLVGTRCAKLETLSFNGTGFEADDMEEAIFKPLMGHRSLAKLEIFGGIGTGPKQVTLTCPLMVAALSVSCPTLKHVAWRSG